jgi:hypothetical protein
MTDFRLTSGARLVVFVGLFATLVASCGGGGGDGPTNPPQVTPAPTGLTYPTPPVFVVGQAITPLTPTVTGTVTSYTVTPVLPAGLSLNASTGVISGTPTAFAATTSHNVSAANSGGHATATVSLTVSDIAPALSATQTQFMFTTGVPVDVTPGNSGGAAVAWSIEPALPAGLTFSATKGTIGGTPAAVVPAAPYVVTAQNSGGYSTLELTIAVESGVLLDLGHADKITALRFNTSRVLSQDETSHWVLWDTDSRDMLASGEGEAVDLAGPTVVIQTARGFEVRSSSDGQVTATIEASPSWWKLSADGSYFVAGMQGTLTAWLPNGEVLLTRSGDYSAARVFAAANEVRIALGPAGAAVVETIAIPNGAITTSPAFQGTFHSWFQDGERFFSHVSNTVWTYSKAAVQEDVTALPEITGLTGQGNWFWIRPSGRVHIYAVGNSAAETANFSIGSLNQAIPSGNTIALLPHGKRELTVVDLSGVTPSRTDYALPVASSSAYAAISPSRWLMGNKYGVVLEPSHSTGGEKYFGWGEAWAIAGSDERVAVATASGHIQYFDAATKALEGTIEFRSSDLAMSADGTVLAAAASTKDPIADPDHSLKIFSLPSGTEVNSWPYTYGVSVPYAMALSASGTVFGQNLFFTRWVTPIAGAPVLWSDVLSAGGGTVGGVGFIPPPIRISPDGTLIAATNGARGPGTGTNIYKNGVLVTAVPGWAAGWINNNRLLVNNYAVDSNHIDYFAGSVIYDALGQKIAEPPPSVGDILSFQVVTNDQVYTRNRIVSLTSGNGIWSSPNQSRGPGAVAGSRVVFASGTVVRAESH